MPVDGRWMLQFYVCGPAFDRSAPDGQNFPTQNVGQPDPNDKIVMTINGQQLEFVNDADNQVSVYVCMCIDMDTWGVHECACLVY